MAQSVLGPCGSQMWTIWACPCGSRSSLVANPIWDAPYRIPYGAHVGPVCFAEWNAEKKILAVRSDIVMFILIVQMRLSTIVPTKSDSDVVFCLQLLSKTLTCTHHFS